jgi:O-antigen/teichoic acid export membrane protein
VNLSFLRNALASYGRYGIRLVVLAWLTPIVVRGLGPDAYGLWVLLFSLIGFASLLDLGFATSVIKITASHRGTGTPERCNVELSTVLVAYIGLAAFATLCLAIAEAPLLRVFAVPAELASAAQWTYWLIGLRSATLLLPLSLFRGVLYGEERIGALSAVQISAEIAWAGAAYSLLASGYGIVALATANLTIMLLEHIALALLCTRLVPQLRLRPGLFDASALPSILSFSGFAFMSSFAGLVLLRTDPIVVKLSLPLAAVASYGVALRICEALNGLLKQMTNLLAPAAARLAGKTEAPRLGLLFSDTTRLACGLGVLVSVPLFIFAPDVLELWVGTDVVEAATPLRLLALATLFSVPQLASSNVLAMTGHHRFTGWCALGSAGANLLLSVLLVGKWGMAGVAAATLLCVVIFDLALVSRRAADLLIGGVGPLLRRSLVPVLLPGSLYAGSLLALRELLGPSGTAQITLIVAASAVIYLSTFYRFGLLRRERQAIRQAGNTCLTALRARSSGRRTTLFFGSSS